MPVPRLSSSAPSPRAAPALGLIPRTHSPPPFSGVRFISSPLTRAAAGLAAAGASCGPTARPRQPGGHRRLSGGTSASPPLHSPLCGPASFGGSSLALNTPEQKISTFSPAFSGGRKLTKSRPALPSRLPPTSRETKTNREKQQNKTKPKPLGSDSSFKFGGGEDRDKRPQAQPSRALGSRQGPPAHPPSPNIRTAETGRGPPEDTGVGRKEKKSCTYLGTCGPDTGSGVLATGRRWRGPFAARRRAGAWSEKQAAGGRPGREEGARDGPARPG